MEITFNKERFQELVLYIAARSESDPAFGATKLNKLLYYSDFLAYAILGEPITGAVYRALKRGPAPRSLLPVQEELVRSGQAALKQSVRFGFPQHRLISLRPPRVGLFTAEQIALVDDLVQTLWGHNASDVSMLSHMEAGWRVAEEGGDIPYESVFLSSERPTPGDMRLGQRLAAEDGLLA